MAVRTCKVIETAVAGIVPAGKISISILNPGMDNAYVTGARLLPGNAVTFECHAGDTLGPVDYVPGYNHTLLISTVE